MGKSLLSLIAISVGSSLFASDYDRTNSTIEKQKDKRAPFERKEEKKSYNFEVYAVLTQEDKIYHPRR